MSTTPSTKSESKESFDSAPGLETNNDTTPTAAPAAERIYNNRPNSDPEPEKPRADDWRGPDDKGNPHNWPTWKKWYHTFMPAGIAFTCTLASSIYVPGQEAVMREFHVSSTVAILPFSLYVLGLAFGPMIVAPCSEVFGRRPVYLIAIPIFALFILGSGFAQSIATLIICRFFAGVFGSPGLSIGSATISDIWTPAQRAAPMSLYVATPFLGPALGPMLGGYATQTMGWRWTQWVQLFFTAAFLAPAYLGMQETYKSAILKRRAKKLGLANVGSGRTRIESAKFFLRSTLTRPIHMGVTEPIVGLFTLYVAINFAMLYAFFGAFEEVMADTYGFDLGQTGLTFLGLGVGVAVGCVFIIASSKFMLKRQARKSAAQGKAAKASPESRLYTAMIGSVMLPIGLFWFAWTARPNIHWISPVIAEAFFGCGNLLIFMSATLYLTDTYGAKYTASAMGANNLARYTLGCAFPLFVPFMYQGLGTGWATSLFGFVSVALMPIPWMFYIWGPKLRARTAYK